MLIKSVDVVVAELANRTLKTSYGSNVSMRRHIFVAVTAEDGQTGYGEGSPLPHFSGERADEMASVVDAVFAPALIGIDIFASEAANHALEKALPHHHASKAALMNAIIDLQGKLTGLPANAFLGGVMRDRLPIGAGIGIEDRDEIISSVKTYWDRGLRTLKFKVGGDVKRDIETIRMVRGEFSEELNIRADANAGYSFADAQRFLHGVADCGLQYFEQPVKPQDWKGLARLRQFGTPIAADESVFSVNDALGLIAAEAVDVIIIKLIKLGGLFQARKVVGIAEAAGVACVIVSPYETALGVAAGMHLAASSSAFSFAAELLVGETAVPLPGIDSIAFDHGFATVPTGPGLGITVPSGLFGAVA